MKIIIVKGNWWEWVKSHYNPKTRTVKVWTNGKNFDGFFRVLSHELGHHVFQLKYERFPFWR